MVPDFSHCVFTEGRISLPEGYNERTLNVLLAEDDTSPSLNISRDILQPGETLDGYITRQLETLSQNMKGWVLKSRDPSALGAAALPGESVHASYLRDGKRIWQRQAVFAIAQGRILVFTLAQTRKLTAQDESLLQQVLDSFALA